MAHPILFNFSKILPKYRYDQAQTVQWLSDFYLQKSVAPVEGSEWLNAKAIERMSCRPPQVEFRNFVVPDFAQNEIEKRALFDDRGAASTGRRNSVFEKIAEDHFRHLYREIDEAPRYLFHVTCTGYASPSAAQKMVNEKKWNTKTSVTHLYHMGCYAALPAIRLAGALAVRQPDFRADIVHTEYCSIHFNSTAVSPEQIVVQSLFADGAIRYQVGIAPNSETAGLLWLGDLDQILPNSEELMGWRMGDSGLLMNLAREVPQVIGERIAAFVNELLGSCQVPTGGLSDMIYAIHPGGPRIIEAIRDRLALQPRQVAHSIEVLRNHGNMSSATLPHVWQSIVEDQNVPRGAWVLSLAFGPGLTIYGAVMRKQ